MRHFLIPWIFALLTDTVLGQQQAQGSLTDLHHYLLQGTPYRPLFERISPLEGLHVLHQAIAVSPLPEAQGFNKLDILNMVTPAPIFSHNHRFLTVTVPNPLYNPNYPIHESSGYEAKTAQIVQALPQTISAAILNATEKDNVARAVEIPNKGGFGASSESVEESEKTSRGIAINKQGDNHEKIVAPKAAEPITDPPSTAATTLVTSTTTTSLPLPSTTIAVTKTSTTTTVKSSPASSTTTVAPKVEKVQESSLNLTHHLNTTNLESFLSTANISTNEAQVFIKLVEKVLEEEVAKRLQKHEEKMQKQDGQKSSSSSEDESPKLAGIKLQPADVQPSIDTLDDHKFINDKYIEEDRHEVKTVDTRLIYEGKGIEENSYEDDNGGVTTTTSKSAIPTISIRPVDVAKLPRRIHSTTSLNLEQARLASGLKKNQQASIIDDYRAREQAEFDEIIKAGQLSSFDTPTTTALPVTVTKPQAVVDNYASYTPRPINRISSHRTEFERLAKDYQYRLSGQNGLNDLIKALRNAKIGFYERPTYRRYHKGNRRN